MLYLTWIRPTETTDGAAISAQVPLTYEVHKGNSSIAIDTTFVAEVSEPMISLSDIGEFVGMYFFVRCKTSNNTMSAFSLGKLLGVPKAPTGLAVEDIVKAPANEDDPPAYT